MTTRRSSGGTAATSFVGRNDELGRIADALADGASPGVVLMGPSGVGKTELARRALEVAESSGFATATVQATQAASAVPFGAFVRLVGDGTAEGPVATLRSIRANIVSRAGTGPLVLLVDDAQHLDDLSATLVHQLAGDDNVFLIATVRTGTRVPDSVTTLWKDAGAHRIDVAPLDLAGTERLIRALLDGPPTIPALSRLVALSQGLPMAVQELVDGGRRSGALVLEDGSWGIVGELTLSDRLVDLVELRLGECSDEQRAALATIALGDPLPLTVATTVTTTEALQALEDLALIDIDAASDDVTVSHPLYGEVAVQSMGELRRRALLNELADASSAHAAESSATRLRVAMWRLAAGAEVGADELLAGAVVAYRSGNHATTIQLAQAAWERDPTPESGHLLGLALGRMTRAEEAEAVLAEATELLDGRADENGDDDRLRVLLALARSENLYRGCNRADAAIECVEAAEAKTTDPTWRDELVGHRAIFVLQSGDVAGAVALTHPLVEAGTPDRPFVKAAYAASLAMVCRGQTTAGGELAQRAMPVHERLWADDLYQTEPGIHHVTAMLALVESGQFIPAEQYADIAVQVAAQAGEGYPLAYMSMLAGLVALRRGHVATSRRRCLDAVPLFRTTGYPSPLRWVLAGAATAEAMTGDVESARARLALVDELAAQTPVRFNEGHVHEARAWTAVAGGDVAAARDQLDVAVAETIERDELASASHLLHLLGRLGPTDAVVDRLDELSASIDGDAHPRRLRHLQALVAGDGAALDEVAEEFAAAGADLLAAEASAEAVRAHRRHGDQRAATRSTRASEGHAARCEGARTPAMAISASVEPLTDREREIALLAAEGLSSKDIAERLYVSRRTVDNHLQRVFGKLGISGRGDLPTALGLTA